MGLIDPTMIDVLLARIDELERRIKALEARPFPPMPVYRPTRFDPPPPAPVVNDLGFPAL